MNYLTSSEIVAIHDLIIEQTGGSLGVRDQHLLSSLAQRPKSSFGGNEHYQTVFDKAASLLEALVQYHVFVDGNKRAGLVVAVQFLRLNDFKCKVTKADGLDFMLRVATEKLSVTDIAKWLESNSIETTI